MAKTKYALSTLSKANKDLALLIDEDLQRESELLQKLIKEVYEANQKVKESHFKRVQETTDKLNILNAEIESLKKDIDQKDQTTTIEQFNYLLRSKDQIFEALNSMRLFHGDYHLKHPLKTHLEMLKNRLIALMTEKESSGEDLTNIFFEPFSQAITQWVETLFDKTVATFTAYEDDSDTFKKPLAIYEDHHHALQDVLKQINTHYTTLQESRNHFFYQSIDDDFLNEKIDKLYQKAVSKIKQRMETAEADYTKKNDDYENQLKTLETDMLDKLKQKYQKKLEEEHTMRDTLQDNLKQLRFDIMSAEKKGDAKTLQTLLKTYDKKEKQNLSLYEEKVKQLARQKTKKIRDKLVKEKKTMELKHQDDRHKLKLQLEIEHIKFTESRALFKIREDQKALENDIKVNQAFGNDLKKSLQKTYDFRLQLLDFITTLEQLYIDQTNDFLTVEVEQHLTLESLKKDFKVIQLELTKHLRQKGFDEETFAVKLESAIKTTKLNIAHQQKIQTLLKDQITDEKTAEVDTIKAQEDTKNELIYQNALVEIAEKEYELQLIKIRSLYDSEVDITKSQAERLNIGLDVNEAMVKTTVESQIIFAEQQIKFAEKEYEARLENIERARGQELSYAEKKLSSAEQKYVFDRNALIQERDHKLEELSYRIALFTDPKDRKKLMEQEQQIKDLYGDRIRKIDEAEESDPQITRYRKQIDSAKARAEKAQQDAQKLKEKTISTFEGLLEQGKEKLDVFTKKSDEALVPYIESEASTTAKERLDEALNESKQQFEEKTETPKAQIEKLMKKLEALENQPREQADAIHKKLETAYSNHYDMILKLDELTQKKLSALKNKETQFEKQFKDVSDTLKTATDIAEQSALKSKMTTMIKKQQEGLRIDTKKRQQAISNQQKATLQAIDDHIAEINKTLDPIIRAYDKYLKSTSGSQTDKQKTIEKTLLEQLKANKEAIEQKY